eukprot:Skav235010  [mRNA]  locus=scaffold276:144395:144676:+ [translate_table: standard]
MGCNSPHGDTRIEVAFLPWKPCRLHRPPPVAGDVIVKLVEAKHATFRRAGVDLHTEITISLREALLGFERSLELKSLAWPCQVDAGSVKASHR